MSPIYRENGKLRFDKTAVVVEAIILLASAAISAGGFFFAIKSDIRQHDWRIALVEKNLEIATIKLNGLTVSDSVDQEKFKNMCTTLTKIETTVAEIRQNQRNVNMLYKSK